jgi:hypothetical protein
MFLDNVNRKLQIVLDAAPVTTQPSFVTSYADLTTLSLTPGMNTGTGTGVTPVDIVAAPATSTQRQIKAITIFNADVAGITVTVILNDNGTARNLVKVALAAGQSLVYSENDGWKTMPGGANGFVPPPLTTILTASGTYNTPTGAKQLRVRFVGGGGGGGGSGTSGGNNGGAGGDTIFNSVTASGGLGGLGTTAQGGLGGTGGAGTATRRQPGGSGGQGDQITTASGFSNNIVGATGGTSMLGGGTRGTTGAGVSAAANSGGGASGGGIGSAGGSGGGGGGGEGVELIIDSPASSYGFTIGAGGTAGTAGTSGAAGGVGGSGVIIVEALFGGAEINFVPGQLRGTATNDDATAGNVAELIESEVLNGAGPTPTSGAATNITFIDLTPGDWNIWGNTGHGFTGGQTPSLVAGWISTVSATLPTVPNRGAMCFQNIAGTAGGGLINPCGQMRLKVAVNTRVYLSARSDWTGGGTGILYGYIAARRAR